MVTKSARCCPTGRCAAAVQPGPPPRHGLASGPRVPDTARGLRLVYGATKAAKPLAVISRTSRSAFSRLPKLPSCTTKLPRAARRSVPDCGAAVAVGAGADCAGTGCARTGGFGGSARGAAAVAGAADAGAGLPQPVPRLLRAARGRQQPAATRRAAARAGVIGCAGGADASRSMV